MINLLGFAALIVITIFAYKTAKDYERNAIGWALITFGAGFVIQIVLPILIFILIAVAMIASGTPPAQVQQDIPDIFITMVCLVLSLVAGFLILRYLSKIPDEPVFDAPPAPPTDYNQYG